MSKAEVVRLWKPTLRRLGFTFTDSMFQFGKTKEEFLQFSISLQKNVHEDTYKINPTILLRNPFLPPHQQEVLLLANLRRDGVYLHVARESWWPLRLIDEALIALERYALPWFAEWGTPKRLANVMDSAIGERKRLIDVIEPLPDTLTTVPWLKSQGPRQIPENYFRDAAVLHFLGGNLHSAKVRTKEWIESLPPSEEAERAKASMQLMALKQIQ